MTRTAAAILLGAAFLTALPAHASEGSKRLTASGLIEFHAGHYRKAWEFFEQAVSLDPEDVYARYYRGVTRARVDDMPGAIADLRAVAAARPDLDEAALELGLALVQTGAYEEALAPLSRAQGSRDLEATASLFLGLAQLRLNRRAEARANFQRAEARDPAQAVASQYYLGVAAYQDGEWESAHEHFTQVVHLNPDSAMGRESAAFLSKLDEIAKREYTIVGGMNFEYDSNVLLAPDNDAIQGPFPSDQKDDGRFQVNLGLSRPVWRSGNLALHLAYDFSQTLQFELTDFNLQDHGPSATLLADVGPWRIGLQGRYDYYFLETDSFLQEATAIPWFSVPEEGIGQFEAFYRMRRRDFKKASFAVFDAFNHAFGLQQTFFLGSPDRSLSLGYQFDLQDPVVSHRLLGSSGFQCFPNSSRDCPAQAFGYTGHGLSAGVAWLLPGSVTAQATYLFRRERYGDDSARLSVNDTGDRRIDKDHMGMLSLRRPLCSWLDVTAHYLVNFNQSNVGIFEYERHIGSIGLEGRY